MWRFEPRPAGAYVLGVPARDLTDDEWAALSEDDRRRAEQSGLYRPAPVKGKGVKDAG